MTVIPEIISEDLTVSADVSGDVNTVFLNIESVDVYGNRIRSCVDMSGENGTYSAVLPEYEKGRRLDVWVSAYSSAGNGAMSEKQTATMMKSESGEPVIAITAINGKDVTVKLQASGLRQELKLILHYTAVTD